MEQPWESPDDSGGPGITPGQAVLSAAQDQAEAARMQEDASRFVATVEEAPERWFLPQVAEGWIRGARLITGAGLKMAVTWQGMRAEADRLAREAAQVQAEVQMLRRVAWGLAGLVLVQALLIVGALLVLLVAVS